MDLATRRRAQVTRTAVGGFEPARLASGKMIVYPSTGALLIVALYLPPAKKLLGDPPPVVVVAHGAPGMQALDAFDPRMQALSQSGFAVLAPNYRGSSGYGRSFLDGNNKDWGGKDLEHIWAGVEHLARQGLADPARAGVTGQSYGGTLTLMALARQPERWRAGVEAFGMPDIKERSAVTSLDRIQAPLLMFQGANDANVPPAESERIYAKLLERRVPVGLIVYRDEGHGFTRRANRADYLRRTVEFFVEQLAR